MKRLLAYLFIVLGLGLTFNVNAEANEIKFKQLKISTGSQKFEKIGSDIRGNVESLYFFNRFFAYTEDNNLKGLIEVFNFDNSGEYAGKMNEWFRNRAFKIDSEGGCNESNKNIFFESIDLNTHVACLNIRKINKDELSSPNFSKAPYVPLSRRKLIIEKFI